MKKHEHPINRLDKMSNFFGGSNFSKLNFYQIFPIFSTALLPVRRSIIAFPLLVDKL